MPYPHWTYFPRNARAAPWVAGFVGVVRAAEDRISTAERKTGLSSDDVLAVLRPSLLGLGYVVEAGKKRDAKIFRPVLFGENGVPEVSYELDAFHEELGIAVEVEAGRGAANNADYRDIVRTALVLDARFMALLLPLRYRSGAGDRYLVPAYENTRNLLHAVYASDRLRLPFSGVLLVGY